MKAKKFELFMCCLGNGISVFNSAVTEHGDYIPEESKKKIESAAEDQRQKWENYFSTLPDIKQYSYILDHLTLNDFMLFIKDDDKPLREKISEGKKTLLQVHF